MFCVWGDLKMSMATMVSSICFRGDSHLQQPRKQLIDTVIVACIFRSGQRHFFQVAYRTYVSKAPSDASKPAAGASSTAANSQFRRFSTGRGLPAIRERHPSGLRRFWRTASGSSTPRRAPSVSSVASSEAEAAQGQAWRFGGRKHAASSKKLPSVSSVASSEQDPAQDQGWPYGARKEAARTREAVSRRSSVSSDLDSAQGIARGGPKVLAPAPLMPVMNRSIGTSNLEASCVSCI